MFEGKTRSDFERVKQKFDSRHSSKSYVGSSSKNSSRKSDRHGSSRVTRSTEMSFDDKSNIMNIHDNSQSFDGETSASKPSYQSQIKAQLSPDKEDNIVDIADNFNLDGFKVSEDDDDDVSSSFETNKLPDSA